MPLVLLGYYLIPGRFWNYWLLAASLLFYAYGEPRFFIVFLCGIAWTYCMGLLIGRCRSKALLALCLLGHLSVLFWFKYAGFIAESFNSIFRGGLPVPECLLPIGISFYTFQEISYVTDVYRGEKAERNPFLLGLYISFFPQLIAGPIVRYGMIRKQFASRPWRQLFIDGFYRFLTGLCEKVLLADRIGELTAYVFSEGNLSNCSAPLLIIGIIGFSFQLYLDFKGYSDMAAGLGAMFGFRLPDNFRDPFLAADASDFWRRWHITLSEWFRDDVYIPLGGNSSSGLLTARNILIVWMLTGLWHGARWTCVLWGAGWALLLIAEKYFFRPENMGQRQRAVYRVWIIAAAILLFILLRISDTSQLIILLKRLFVWRMDEAQRGAFCLWMHDKWIYLACAAAVCFKIPRIRPAGSSPAVEGAVKWGKFILLLLAAALAVSYIVNASYSPFLYYQF